VSILQAIILGLTQGVTEFAPVSSSGHLILVPWLFNWSILNDPNLNKTFDVALHIGTLVGALAYFRADVWRYLSAFGQSVRARSVTTTDQRLAWALVIGTIPGAVAGAVLEDPIQQHLGQPWLIAVMLAVFGVILYAVDLRAPQDQGIHDITIKRGGILGLAQALALQPGVSRSGVTITAGRLMGLNREAAARFSFLLAMPIIAGAGIYKAFDLAQTGLQGYGSEFFWGFVSSAISGFLVIWGVLKYLRNHDFKIFMIYRIAVALVVVVAIALGRPAGG
jgi:undecaprenyl-diphosphatase